MKITPSRFLGDPLGYAGNQCGHWLIGASASMVVMLLGVHFLWAAPLASILYWVKIEYLPGQTKLDWADSFDDTVHAYLGAALFSSIGLSFPLGEFSGDWTAPLVFLSGVSFMLWQMWRRYNG